MRTLIFLLLAALAQPARGALITVDAANKVGPFPPIYAFFGYDEPNYTYTPNGRKLIGELGALSRSPVYIRTHFLLATGDGKPGLKFGSTNAYLEDAAGRPVYNWTVTDRIFDTYLNAGAKPFVEIGFMPKALSSNPEPYAVPWIPGAKNLGYSAGWSYPPNDYRKWSELVYQWVKHAVRKYGRREVESWYWEVWNEPDISYWHGTPEEYNKLYDYAAAGVKRALPTARVGGPATTGPANAKAAAYLQQFLEHCNSGRNLATGAIGSPLDFITFHAKGRPEVAKDHVRMGIAKNLQDAQRGFAIVSSFPRFRSLPIILSESDPEGCAACSARVYPQNAYRNGTLYPAYTAVMMKNILDLAAAARVNLAGMMTWAFEFEDQPFFDGFRTLATNGIDKPVLNEFRMAGLMRGDRVAVDSSAAVPLARKLQSGVRGSADLDALATRHDREVDILLWNYHDDDLPGPASEIKLDVKGLPQSEARVLLTTYRIDQAHSNSYSVWQKLGSPQKPTREQYAELEAAGQLQQSGSPQWTTPVNGSVRITLPLPRQAISLVKITW